MNKIAASQIILLCIVLASILFSTYHLSHVLAEIRKEGKVEKEKEVNFPVFSPLHYLWEKYF